MKTETNTATALQIAPPAPAVEIEIELAADERPVAPPATKTCPLCFSHEKHDHVEGATCSVCAHVHGDQIFRGGKQRKTVVRHSLPVERMGGTRDGKWTAAPICDDCAWDVKRASRKGSRRAPRFFDLAANLVEVTARDGRDVEFRTQRAADRKAEDERRARIDLLVAKGYRVSRDQPQRNDRGPQQRRNGDQRGNGGGQQRIGRDGRGNPSFGGRGYVTPEDVERAE
ncbi:MAG: hypothetical protein Q7S02_00165 [bacterium]|nr:hypothetical protein [bacterium]